MRLPRITLLGFVFATIAALTVQAQTTDFRNFNWGSNAASVKEKEKCKMLSDGTNKLMYDCPLGETDTKVIYTFTGSDKLMRGKYYITPDYFNMVFYIRDFRMYEDLLSQKYGKPEHVSPKVISKESVSDDEWATYLNAGELRVEARWVTAKTEILLTMSKVGPYPAIQIDYISLELGKEDLKEKSKAIIKDL